MLAFFRTFKISYFKTSNINSKIWLSRLCQVKLYYICNVYYKTFELKYRHSVCFLINNDYVFRTTQYYGNYSVHSFYYDDMFQPIVPVIITYFLQPHKNVFRYRSHVYKDWYICIYTHTRIYSYVFVDIYT